MSKMRVFTEEELQYILKNWGSVSVHEMRTVLNCSQIAIMRVAEQYHLELPSNRFWTKEDIKRLKELAPHFTIEEIAKKIGRSKNAISLKAAKLGIDLSWSRREWTR